MAASDIGRENIPLLNGKLFKHVSIIKIAVSHKTKSSSLGTQSKIKILSQLKIKALQKIKRPAAR